jgi:YebC/PmpR family DNA-binding regulatory protein
LTDNRNRTASEVRAAFTKSGGALGETGSVGFMFEHVGEIVYPAAAASADDMLEAAIEAGADNVESGPDGHEVTTSVEDFFPVRDALEARFGAPVEAKLDWRPATTVTLDEEKAAAVMKLLDAIDDSDDVQNVYANYDIPEAVLQKLSA